MGQFLQVNGDYNIKTREGAKITLDPGATGQVRVTGNLLVEGDTLTVSVRDLEVEDNIIVLNFGEVGPGVSLTYAGIEIDRGSGIDSSVIPRASLLFDESSESWLIATGSAPDDLNYTESNLRVRRILTNPVTDNGDLILISEGTGVVKVGDRSIGATGYNYEDFVLDEDDLPNKKYVDDAIQNNPTFQIRSPGSGVSGDTRIIIGDINVSPNNSGTPGSLLYYEAETNAPYSLVLDPESVVGIFVDGLHNSTFYSNRAVIQELEIQGTTISAFNTSADIRLRTHNGAKVILEYALQMEDIGLPGPAYVPGSHILFGSTLASGDTGLYFINGDNRRDELVSRRRALLWSMIF
jgi:hypothetical protein